MITRGYNAVAGFFRPRYRYGIIFAFLLSSAVAFTLLDAFVIPKSIKTVQASGAARQETAASGDAEITEFSYKDGNIEIVIETVRAYETDVYVADIKVSDASYLKTAFADNSFGRNISAKTSSIAGEQEAIFAVNGDYYGFRDSGWVLRNGVVYRSEDGYGAFVMENDGTLRYENSGQSILDNVDNLRQAWAFGPLLVAGGEIDVTENQEISGRSSNSNPRTAIGQVDELHYVFIVSDGRTSKSAGLSLFELANIFKERGCAVAYNLDGGGSATMYFNGRVINSPTTNGRSIREREVSDIVYIGY
jgi:exopolysaccharide biosynthesis protein